jgi:large subunit ribosomal protein L21
MFFAPSQKEKDTFMYAVIRTGAKQYRVQPGDVLEVELLDGEKGKEIALEDVLLVADGEKIQVGKPNIKGARVTAEVIDEDKKGKKVIAFKFRRREGYHRKRGIRAHHTVLKIKEIIV